MSYRSLAGVMLAVSFSCLAHAAETDPLLKDRPLAREADGRARLLVLPPDLKLYQLGASAVTTHEIPEWSQQAEANALASMRQFLADGTRFAPVELPALDEAELKLLDEHLALADTVAYTAFINKQFGGKPWLHKQGAGFDYTLGDGLRFLRERSGADLAVFAVGVDSISTGGRAAMGILAFALAGAVVGGGQTFMMIGVVELDTGKILWLNHRSKGSDLRERDNVHEYLDALLCQYPFGSLMVAGKIKECGRQWKVAPDGTLGVARAGGSKR